MQPTVHLPEPRRPIGCVVVEVSVNAMRGSSSARTRSTSPQRRRLWAFDGHHKSKCGEMTGCLASGIVAGEQ